MKKLSKLEYLNLTGCDGILDFIEIVDVVNMLGGGASYPGKFGNDLIAKSSEILNLSDTTVTKSVFERMKGATNLYALNLRKTKITNDDGSEMDSNSYNKLINDVLSSCSGMKYLEISYQTLLTDISFVKKMKNLYELNLLSDDALTDLSSLEEMAELGELKLNTLMLSNSNIDLTKIQTALSTVCDDVWIGEYMTLWKDDDDFAHGQSFWYSYKAISNSDNIYGLVLNNFDLMKQLENCTEVTNLVINVGWRSYFNTSMSGELNLTKLTKLKLLFFARQNIKLILPSNLERLYCSQTKPVNVDLSNCKMLKTFKAFCINAKDSYKTIFNTLPDDFSSLEYMWLQDQRTVADDGVVYNDNLDWLEKFKNCKNFKGLVINQNNTWTTYNWKSLEGLKFIENLEHLELNFTINDGGCLSDFPDLSGLTNLKFLQIKYGNMNLDKIKTCKSLEELVINNTFIQNVNFLSEINGLKKIDLSNNRINDIYGLLRKTMLSELKLGYNDLIDISPLSDLSALQHLELNNNKLSDFGYDNTGKSYYTQSVLTDLNQKYNLKNLYLWGNLYDDYSIITSDDLRWDSLILDEKDKPKEET